MKSIAQYNRDKIIERIISQIEKLSSDSIWDSDIEIEVEIVDIE